MIKHMLSSALFAGFAVGLFAALLQFAFVEKDILLAEQYETGALVHFGAAPGGDDHAAMAMDTVPSTATTEPAGTADGATAMAPDAGHDHHKHEVDGEASPLVRHGLSVLFAALIYVGYAFVLVSGYALAGQFGRKIDVQTGLLWGLAGFMACQMAPAMGLEPELPGTLAASLEARQLWWAGTMVATVAGLGLLGYGRTAMLWGLALLLLAVPHMIGAPVLDGYSGVAPPELAASFAARSLGVGLIAWVVLGGLLAWLWTGPEA